MTVTIHRDVVYSRPPGYRPVSLDLYVPAADRARLTAAVPVLRRLAGRLADDSPT